MILCERMKKLFLVFMLLVMFISGCNQIGVEQYPNSFQESNVSPVQIVQKDSCNYFIDFGKDAFGSLSFQFNKQQSDSLVIHLGEKLADNHTIDRNPGGTIRYKKIVLKDVPYGRQFRLEIPPDGRNDKYPAVLLPDTFGRIMPFRYCELENLKVPVSEVSIRQMVYNYRFNDNASAFSSSDTVLNQVWDMCKHTIKATSFCGKYIDGDRERIPYEADAFINQLSHYAVDSVYSLARSTNKYFIDHPTWPTEWILHTVLLFYYDYMYTGDTSLLSQYYKDLQNKTLMGLEEEDGLISTSSPNLTKELMNRVGFDINYTGRKIEDIVDWPPNERDGYNMVDVNTVVNSFYYLNMKLMAEIAEALGKKEDVIFYSRKALDVKNSINNNLLSRETGIYVDGKGTEHSSLHANIFPLAFGIVPEENKNKVIEFIKSRGMACSVYGAQYLLEAMYHAGEGDYALSLINSTEGDRNWWNMLKKGSTMTLEAWDAKYKSNLDWNHAWGTAPANIITRYLWGIQPMKPGFESVRIKPQMSDIKYSSIKAPTIKGVIVAEYKSVNDTGLFIVNLPSGMKGEFVTLNNKSVELVEGMNQLIITNN